MPSCPKCLQAFHRGADTACPHCGFSLSKLNEQYGTGSVDYRRVTDNAGALKLQDRIQLAKVLEKLEQHIPPVLLSVYYPGLLEPFSLIPHSFWKLNHLVADEAGFPNRKDPIDPQWLFILVLDVHTDTACFIWGYQLDPYVEPDIINKSIRKARIPLRDGQLAEATITIMKSAVNTLLKRARHLVRHPLSNGLIIDNGKGDEA